MKLFKEKPEVLKNVIRSVESLVECLGEFFHGKRSFSQTMQMLRVKISNWGNRRLDASTVLLRGRLVLDDSIFGKLENLIERMMDPKTGVTRTIENTVQPNGTALYKFSGKDLMKWIQDNVETKNPLTKDDDLLYLAYVLVIYGYMYTVEGHVLLQSDVEDKYYCFQSPFYWFTNMPNPEEYDYAVYLVKRTLDNTIKSKLEDYEEQNLKKLEMVFYKDWLDIKLQAEVELNKHRMIENKHILDTQERALWDMHRPKPSFEVIRELDYDKLRNIKEIAEWTVSDIMRSYGNISTETIV